MYVERFTETFVGYARWLGSELTRPHAGNWVLWLVGVSAAVYAWELLAPWRRDQPRIRKDFWLDAFYMAFNVFLFNLIGYAAVSDVVVHAFQDLLRSWFGIENLVAIRVGAPAKWRKARRCRWGWPRSAASRPWFQFTQKLPSNTY